MTSRHALRPLSLRVLLCVYQSSEHSLPTYAGSETFANTRDRSGEHLLTLRRRISSAKLTRSALFCSRIGTTSPRGIYTCELRLLHARWRDRRTNYTRPRYICMRETPDSDGWINIREQTSSGSPWVCVRAYSFRSATTDALLRTPHGSRRRLHVSHM